MKQRQTVTTEPSCDEQSDELYEVAINMAANAFQSITDDHVEGVYDRLVWNTNHGLGQHGATTVH